MHILNILLHYWGSSSPNVFWFLRAKGYRFYFLVFLSKRSLSLSAIISITENDNWLLDSIIRKLKRFRSNDFPSESMQQTLQLVGAKSTWKLDVFVKFSHALWRHHYVSFNLLEVLTYPNVHFRQLSSHAGVQSCCTLFGCRDITLTKYALCVLYASMGLYVYLYIYLLSLQFCYRPCEIFQISI